VSTAESCTGGMLAGALASVSGASAYFLGSVVSYDNQVKVNQLGVRPETLVSFGAVSEEVVIEMAKGVKERLKTDYSIATSGVAGPTGGSPEKPVGTVWIAISGPTGTAAKKFQFGDVRERNIQRSVIAALNFLRIELQS
jgi:nicotinamide-nucleotide amidase